MSNEKTWGGARPGAGRPRTRPERLTAVEVRLLLDMLRGSLYADQHGALAEKLERMEQAEKDANHLLRHIPPTASD